MLTVLLCFISPLSLSIPTQQTSLHSNNPALQKPLQHDSCKKMEKRLYEAHFFQGQYQLKTANGVVSDKAMLFAFHSDSFQKGDTTFIEYSLTMDSLALSSSHQILTCYSLNSSGADYILLVITDIHFQQDKQFHDIVLLSQPIPAGSVQSIDTVEFNGTPV